MTFGHRIRGTTPPPRFVMWMVGIAGIFLLLAALLLPFGIIADVNGWCGASDSAATCVIKSFQHIIPAGEP